MPSGLSHGNASVDGAKSAARAKEYSIVNE